MVALNDWVECIGHEDVECEFMSVEFQHGTVRMRMEPSIHYHVHFHSNFHSYHMDTQNNTERETNIQNPCIKG